MPWDQPVKLDKGGGMREMWLGGETRGGSNVVVFNGRQASCISFFLMKNRLVAGKDERA